MKKKKLFFVSFILAIILMCSTQVYAKTEVSGTGSTYSPGTVKISLNKTKISVKAGSSIILKAKVSGTSNKVSWSTSNSTIAKVKNGKVTGIKTGVAKITAKVGSKKATCIVTVIKVKYTPTQFSDYNKVHKLIRYFDVPIGFCVNPAMSVGEIPSCVDNKFMTVCSAWHVNEKHWKEINSDGYGEYAIDKKYIDQECKKIFGKISSLTGLSKYGSSKKSYLFAHRSGNKVILPQWSSPYEVTSKINSITKVSVTSYQVQITYTAKNYWATSGLPTRQKRALFTLKKVKSAPYGYYVIGFKFI